MAELLAAVTGLPFEAGGPGADEGVDILAVVDGERHVVQCKHYVHSPYSRLKRAAKKEAKGLAGAKKPIASYRFVTSKPLSHTQRDELVEILEPWIGPRDRVIGETDLREFLKQNGTVERHHPKLWFRGADQLRETLSAASFERSQALLEEIHRRLPRYVRTDALFEARGILDSESVCIIAGPAGVGKTTMGRLLLLDCVEAGFQPYEIVRGGLREAWELLERDKKQVFFFDDFLGRTALFESREEDQDLMRFIQRIAKDPQRRLILTTREYILKQARRISETLDMEGDDGHRYLLTAGRYTRRERARIFYNHLYASPEIDAVAKNALISSRRYMAVVDHPGYSPRLIEWITGFAGDRLTAEEKADYGQFCLDVLNSPGRLWTHAFEQGIEEPERALLLTLCGLPERVSEGTLETAFEAACRARGLTATGRKFQHALDVLEDSFISSIGSEGYESDGAFLSLINPSLLDYLKEYVTDSRPDAETVLRGTCFFEQVEWLWGACRGDAELPPEDLWPAFDDALSRVFDSPPVVYQRSWYEEPPRRQPGPDIDSLPPPEPVPGPRSMLGPRLELVADCLEHRWFRDSFSSWLPTQIQAWLYELDGLEESNWQETELLIRLLAHDIPHRRVAGEMAKGEIDELEPSAERWRLLDALSRAYPEVVSSRAKDEERQEFASFIESALFDSVEYLFGLEGLDELLSVARSWDLVPDGESLKEARHQLEEQVDEERREEAEYEAQMEARAKQDRRWAAKHGKPDLSPALKEFLGRGEETKSIDAMFSLLVEEEGRDPAGLEEGSGLDR